MGIVVCICMLLGLSVLRPTPWNRSKRARHGHKYGLFVAVALLGLGLWNVIYGYLNISGFWLWASLVSGIAMVLASFYILAETNVDIDSQETSDVNAQINNSKLRNAVVTVLALSFLVYAITLVQLNLGYPILR